MFSIYCRGGTVSAACYWLTIDPMAQLWRFFAKSHGRPRRWQARSKQIIFLNRNGLRWYDVPKEYGPAEALYNSWNR